MSVARRDLHVLAYAERRFLLTADTPPSRSSAGRSGVAAGPNGDNGWYTGTRPTVAAVPVDAGGSGLHAVPPFPDTLCAPVPQAGRPAPIGRLRLGGREALSRYTGDVTIPEGEHEVLAFAVDVSGQRSRTASVSVDVDFSPPVSAGRVVPPDPARSPWWRAEPRVILRATDGERNAGLARIAYRIDNGALTTYTGPFALPEGGTHKVTYYSVDRSGQQEPPRELTVPADLAPPAGESYLATGWAVDRLARPPGVAPAARAREAQVDGRRQPAPLADS